MSEQRACCAAAASGVVKKLTLRDGFQVGIWNLDNILKEVADLNLVDAKTIKEELLKRVKIHNYLASGAETDYSAALFQEYRRQFGESK